jgi:hypothetical protein
MHSNALRLTLFLAAVPGVVACGDDSNPATDARVDAPRVIDGTPDGPTFKEFDADEGGEVRIEYVRFPASATPYAGARVTAFFYKDAGPTEFNPFVNLNGCTDTTGDVNWPVASAPAADKVYADPGSVIISGGPMVLNVPKAAGVKDPVGRAHTSNAWHFRFGGPPPGGTPDGANYLTEKTTYDVILTGSADIAPTVFADVGYMPADFAITSHDTFPLTMASDADQTYTWSLPADTPPAGFTVNSLVAVTGGDGPAFLCIEPQNDGSITVPAAMLAVARAKYPGGTTPPTLARQTLTHVVHELMDGEGNPTGKRIDFLTVWCYANGFTWAP